eukprot:scaffold18606_cov60-Phaeocystis_antarctica.AAC.8
MVRARVRFRVRVWVRVWGLERRDQHQSIAGPRRGQWEFESGPITLHVHCPRRVHHVARRPTTVRIVVEVLCKRSHVGEAAQRTVWILDVQHLLGLRLRHPGHGHAQPHDRQVCLEVVWSNTRLPGVPAVQARIAVVRADEAIDRVAKANEHILSCIQHRFPHRVHVHGIEHDAARLIREELPAHLPLLNGQRGRDRSSACVPDVHEEERRSSLPVHELVASVVRTRVLMVGKPRVLIGQRRFVDCRACLQGFEHVRLQHLVCAVEAQGVGAVELVVAAVEELQAVDSER